MVLLNRRGYAPLMYCLDCSRVLRCPQCEIGLTYHKGLERLVCHYCGYSLPFPTPCPHCGGTDYLPLGEGRNAWRNAWAYWRAGPYCVWIGTAPAVPAAMEEILAAFARRKRPSWWARKCFPRGTTFRR